MFKTRMILAALVAATLVSLATVGPAMAGPLDGEIVGAHRVAARSQDSFVVYFRGGETAMVAVSGDGDTDLDLYVYDENGNLIGSDTDSLDDCLVVFRPRWTGPFRIVVRNLGGVYNDYRIGAW